MAAIDTFQKIGRLLDRPEPDELFNLVRMITKNCQSLTEEQRSELWFRIDRLLIARFTVASIPIKKVNLVDYLRGLFPNAVWVPLDSYHWVTTLEAMKKIATVDWTNRREYITQRFDCENFARKFQDHLADHYLINGVPEIHGWPPDHGFNLLVGFKLDSDELESLFFEPQTDAWWTHEDNEAGKTPFNLKYNVNAYQV